LHLNFVGRKFLFDLLIRTKGVFNGISSGATAADSMSRRSKLAILLVENGGGLIYPFGRFSAVRLEGGGHVSLEIN